MTARVITITSGKGGVGKTTATANLGVALAALGNKVVCVDADIGLRNLDVVMGLENRIVYDIVDVVEGRAKLRQAMIRDKRLKDELYLIPAAQTRDKTALSPSDMVRLCDELRPLVDYILVDSPAGIERGFRNAIAPADEVLIVTNPEVSSVRDADRIIGLLEAEQKGPGKLIINRVKPEMVKRGDMLSPEDIIDILAIQLIGLVPEDESILVSTNRGKPVALNTEESLAGRAFTNIARRLTGEKVPFMPLEEETNWLQRTLRKLKLSGEPAAAASTSRKKAEPAAASAAPAQRRAPIETEPAADKPTPAKAAEAAMPPAESKTAPTPESTPQPQPPPDAARPAAAPAPASASGPAPSPAPAPGPAAAPSRPGPLPSSAPASGPASVPGSAPAPPPGAAPLRRPDTRQPGIFPAGGAAGRDNQPAPAAPPAVDDPAKRIPSPPAGGPAAPRSDDRPAAGAGQPPPAPKPETRSGDEAKDST